MAQPKTYFLAPDFDCPPDTAIRVGHILSSPKDPYETLNHDELVPVPSSIAISTTKTGFTATRSQLHSGTYGVFAQILEGAYGAGVSYSHENNREATFGIDELITTFIQPAGKETKEYIQKSVEVDGVREYFEGSRFRKSVYMIVGLKIAKGAKISHGLKKSKEGVLDLMADGSAVGIPAQVGPKFEHKKETGEGMKWEDEKSFVFAYRLRKITCKKGKVKEDEAFAKGAFLDAGSGLTKAAEEEEVHYLIEEEDVDIEEGESGNIFTEEDLDLGINEATA